MLYIYISLDEELSGTFKKRTKKFIRWLIDLVSYFNKLVFWGGEYEWFGRVKTDRTDAVEVTS